MKNPGRLSVRTKVLFSTGDLSTGIPVTLLMFFQLYFLTDVAGLRPALAAWAIAAGRIWDAVNDPLIGLIADRINSRFGRRRVLLLIGALPLGISFFLMWTVPALSPVLLTVYYALIFIIFDTAYTIIHVGYNALTPEMTKDYDERSSLNGYRMAYSIAGGIITIVLATVLGWYIDDSRSRFFILGIGLAVISTLPLIIVFRVSRNNRSHPKQEHAPFKTMLTATLKTRPFWSVIAIYLFSWTTASIMSAVLIYYANYHLRVPDQANYFVLAAQVSAILFIPLSVYLAKRTDKRASFIIGTASWICVLAAISLLGPDAVLPAYVLAVLSGFGIATAYVIPWSMIPDIIEYDQLRTGMRREGSFYSFAAFFQKLGTGTALWLMALALEFSGYITPVPGEALPRQPASAVLAIRIFIGPVPAVLLIASILVAWRYPISRKYHQDLTERLAD